MVTLLILILKILNLKTLLMMKMIKPKNQNSIDNDLKFDEAVGDIFEI